MGQKPASDPNVLLKACMNTWQVTRKEQTCELFYTSVRKLSAGTGQCQMRHASDQNSVETIEERRASPCHHGTGTVERTKHSRFLLSYMTVEIRITLKRILSRAHPLQDW